MLKIDGYVLVGGDSSRMGRPKYALRFGGATFSERAAAALQTVASRRVSFVTGARQKIADAELLPLAVPRVVDIFPNKAALGGIYTGLKYSGGDWTAILACDYPFVTAELFERLAEITGSVAANVAAVAPVQPDGRIQPLCALYQTEYCLDIAPRLLAGDTIAPARRLLENAAARLVDFKELADLPGADKFFINVNTPDDFSAVQNSGGD